MNEKKEKFQQDCSTYVSKLTSNFKDILENLKIIFIFPNFPMIFTNSILIPSRKTNANDLNTLFGNVTQLLFPKFQKFEYKITKN